MVNYWELKARAAAHWMAPLFDRKIYRMRKVDGRFEHCDVVETGDMPWRFIGFGRQMNCPWLHRYLFDVVSPRTPIGQFIPRRCHQCWKIVVEPKTIEQLFLLESTLIQLDWPSKCGVETRGFVPRIYGGYIYNNSQEEGLERLEIFRRILSGVPGLEDVDCFLKRACTEFEMAFPDSTSWEITDEQNEIEDILDDLVIMDIPRSLQARHVLDVIYMRWIEHAADNNDMTYLKYTSGIPFTKPSLRYERATETEADTQGGETVPFSPSAGEVPKGMGQLETKENSK